MKPPIKTNAGYLPVNGTMGTQQLLFNHMSNHYRRLYNAKSKVDSSVPVSYHIAVQKDEARRRSRQVLPRSSSMLHGFNEEDVKFNTHQNQSELRCTCLEKDLVPSTRQARSRYRAGSGSAEQKALESPVKSSRNSSASSTRSKIKTNIRPRSSSRNSSASRQTGDAANSRSRSASRKKIDLIEEHAENFKHLNEPFTPRILKTDAQSKLLGLKVYHPPRRRRKTVQETSHQKEEKMKSPSSTDSGASSARSIEQLNVEEQVPHCTCGQDSKPSSRMSSRDSAYSGGVVSPAESRGPTPEQGDLKPNSSAVVYQLVNSSPGSSSQRTDIPQKIPLDCNMSTSRSNLCYQPALPSSRTLQKFSYNANIRQRLKDSFSAYSIDIEDVLVEIEGIIDEKTLLEELVEEFEISLVSGNDHIKKMSAKMTSGTEKRLEDAAYVKFVHDITEDILAKGEYSDLGLQLLFERHIAENLNQLDVARMREEIAVLSAKLGISSDKPPGKATETKRSESTASPASKDLSLRYHNKLVNVGGAIFDSSLMVKT